MKPYKERRYKNISYRTFSSDTPDQELVWHRDKEDRRVVALHSTNWQIQLDNELPRKIDKPFIPKGVYHRLIKGSGDLKVKIIKL